MSASPSVDSQPKPATDQYRDPSPAPLWLDLVAKLIRRIPVGRYSLIWWLRHGPKKAFLVRTPKSLGGDTFQFSFGDQIERQVFLGGCYEPQESACIRDILRPGMTFIDVGANWGFFTLMAAHLVGPSGKVVAIEADPRVFARLKQNVTRNLLRQVQIFEMAVADRHGTVTLAGHSESAGNPGVSRLVENGSAEPLKFSVKSCPLDSLLQQTHLENIDLLKIDVEGAEDLVLEGMEEGLRSRRYHRILLEIHPLQLAERGRTAREVIAVLTEHGYRGYALDYFKALRKAHYKPWLHSSEFIMPLQNVEIDNSGHLSADESESQNLHTIWFSPNQSDYLQL
ncbi:MAG TPA: FkbM family methyltransferase [Candidatus Angelobacter sp.]|nr:FkbM family methyltransferase [Candidatus Angelobacter sp.]